MYYDQLGLPQVLPRACFIKVINMQSHCKMSVCTISSYVNIECVSLTPENEIFVYFLSCVPLFCGSNRCGWRETK